MSIREQIEDARLLVEHGRYLGALTLALSAVAASSKRVYPRGTRSLSKPSKKMDDREAFTTFLGSRLATILFDEFGEHEKTRSGIVFQGMEGGEELDLSEVLYVFFRCALVHEGKLPSSVAFGPRPENYAVCLGSDPEAYIELDGKLRLDYGWLDILYSVVTNAKCNAYEFNVEHYDLVPKNHNISCEELDDVLIKKYDSTLKRLEILKEVVRILSCETVLHTDREQLSHHLKCLLAEKRIGYSSLIGLNSKGFTDLNGSLTGLGFRLLHEIASEYERIPV